MPDTATSPARTERERTAYLDGFRNGIRTALIQARTILDHQDQDTLEHACAAVLDLTLNPPPVDQ